MNELPVPRPLCFSPIFAKTSGIARGPTNRVASLPCFRPNNSNLAFLKSFWPATSFPGLFSAEEGAGREKMEN